MVDPVTTSLIIGAVGAGAKGLSKFLDSKAKKKISKMRQKETKRETLSDLLNEAIHGSADLEAQRLSRGAKRARRASQTHHETADTIRGALNI